MAAVDPGMPITFVRTLKEEVSNYFTQQRFIARLTSFFGILSLLLASMGICGVTGYNVGRRNNEIGVRIAVGATRGNIVRLVLGGAIRLVLFGLLIGLPLAFAAGRLLGNQLYGTDPHDPPIMLGAALALGSSALVASAAQPFAQAGLRRLRRRMPCASIDQRVVLHAHADVKDRARLRKFVDLT